MFLFVFGTSSLITSGLPLPATATTAASLGTFAELAMKRTILKVARKFKNLASFMSIRGAR
jgi:hypothetical protein